jgi:hypothetical protein
MNPWARSSVDLVRAPAGIPLEPRPAADNEGRMSFGSGEDIAKNPARGAPKVDETPTAQQQHSTPASSNGMAGVLQAAQMPGEVVTGTQKWLTDGVVPGKSAADLTALDATDSARARAELQHLWGNKYQANIDALTRYVGALPEHEAEVMLNARDPATGRAYLNDPAVAVRLAGLARAPQPQVKGEMTVDAIEKFMRTNPAAYRKDESLQNRYRQLLDQRESAKRER